jgi:hypothetical protein
LESASASQTLLSGSVMLPSDLLSQQNVGHPIWRQLSVWQCGMLALNQRQARLFVPGDQRRREIGFRVRRDGQALAEQVSHRVLELAPFMKCAELYLLYEPVRKIKGRFHSAIFLVSQLSVKARKPTDLSSLAEDLAMRPGKAAAG